MVELVAIKKGFMDGQQYTNILENLHFKIDQGESVAIKGKSGCGKSTLLHILAGLLPFEEGKMLFAGKNLSQFTANELAAYRRESVAYVTQKFHLLDDRNVFNNIALPLQYLKVPKREIKNRVEEISVDLQIENQLKKDISSLSGGERQRVAIARAIIKKPALLLADEPTGSLDEITEQSILKVFNMLHQKGMTIIIVTHDDTVSSHCQKVYELHHKQLHLVG